jgi:hypothetical protein
VNASPSTARAALLSFFTFGAALPLVGCGGGGDDSAGTPVAVAPSFDAATAFRSTLATSKTWTTTGTQNNTTATVALTLAPAGTGNFNGSSYSKSHQTATLQVGGITLNSTATDVYFDPATYQVAGSQDTTPAANCTVTTRNTTLPSSTAHVGDSATLYTEDKRAGCGATVTSRVTTTWSLETDQGVNQLCLNTVEKNLADTVLNTGATCFELNAAGALGDRTRVSFGTPTSTTVVTRNY